MDFLVRELSVYLKNDGEIVKCFVNLGEFVFVGLFIFSMIDLNNFWVIINLWEDCFNVLKIGDVIEGVIFVLKYKNVKFCVFFINFKGNFVIWRVIC